MVLLFHNHKISPLCGITAILIFPYLGAFPAFKKCGGLIQCEEPSINVVMVAPI
jgi:hypothetical protein